MPRAPSCLASEDVLEGEGVQVGIRLVVSRTVTETFTIHSDDMVLFTSGRKPTYSPRVVESMTRQAPSGNYQEHP